MYATKSEYSKRQKKNESESVRCVPYRFPFLIRIHKKLRLKKCSSRAEKKNVLQTTGCLAACLRALKIYGQMICHSLKIPSLFNLNIVMLQRKKGTREQQKTMNMVHNVRQNRQA